MSGSATKKWSIEERTALWLLFTEWTLSTEDCHDIFGRMFGDSMRDAGRTKYTVDNFRDEFNGRWLTGRCQDWNNIEKPNIKYGNTTTYTAQELVERQRICQNIIAAAAQSGGSNWLREDESGLLTTANAPIELIACVPPYAPTMPTPAQIKEADKNHAKYRKKCGLDVGSPARPSSTAATLETGLAPSSSPGYTLRTPAATPSIPAPFPFSSTANAEGASHASAVHRTELSSTQPTASTLQVEQQRTETGSRVADAANSLNVVDRAIEALLAYNPRPSRGEADAQQVNDANTAGAPAIGPGIDEPAMKRRRLQPPSAAPSNGNSYGLGVVTAGEDVDISILRRQSITAPMIAETLRAPTIFHPRGLRRSASGSSDLSTGSSATTLPSSRISEPDKIQLAEGEKSKGEQDGLTSRSGRGIHPFTGGKAPPGTYKAPNYGWSDTNPRVSHHTSRAKRDKGEDKDREQDDDDDDFDTNIPGLIELDYVLLEMVHESMLVPSEPFSTHDFRRPNARIDKNSWIYERGGPIIRIIDEDRLENDVIVCDSDHCSVCSPNAIINENAVPPSRFNGMGFVHIMDNRSRPPREQVRLGNDVGEDFNMAIVHGPTSTSRRLPDDLQESALRVVQRGRFVGANALHCRADLCPMCERRFPPQQ